MNLIKISNNLKQLTDQALVQEINRPSGAAPSYMVLAELKRRQDLRKGYAPAAGEEKTVAEEKTMDGDRAGIAAMMPAQMGADIQRGFSGGGAVRGYANGGNPTVDTQLEDFKKFLQTTKDPRIKNLNPDYLIRTFQNATPSRRNQLMNMIGATNALDRAGPTVAASNAIGGLTADEMKVRSSDAIEGPGGEIVYPDTGAPAPEVDIETGKPVVAAAPIKTASQIAAENAAGDEARKAAWLKTMGAGQKTPEAAKENKYDYDPRLLGQPTDDEAMSGQFVPDALKRAFLYNSDVAAQEAKAGKPAATREEAARRAAESDRIFRETMQGKGIPQRTQAGADAGLTPAPSAGLPAAAAAAGIPSTGNRIEDALNQYGISQSKFLDAQAKRLQDARDALAGRRNEALNLAMISGGLGMASTPGNFLQALVGGAREGLGAYASGLGGIRKDERELLKEQGQLERYQTEAELGRQKLGVELLGVEAATAKAVAQANIDAAKLGQQISKAEKDQAIELIKAGQAANLAEALSMVRMYSGQQSGPISSSTVKKSLGK